MSRPDIESLSEPTGFEYLNPGSEVTLTNCDREAVHLMGAIQPCGMLAAINSTDRTWAGLSENVIEYSERSDVEWLNSPPAQFFGGDTLQWLSELVWSPFQSSLRIGQYFPWCPTEHLDIEVHKTKKHIVFELSECCSNGYPSLIDDFINETSTKHTSTDLADTATDILFRTTGVDQVVLYRFDNNFNGEAIAESRKPDKPSYKHLWFPENDVPLPARLVMSKRPIGVVFDHQAAPVPVSFADGHSREDFDMSRCSIRSVSKMCSLYYQNMGIRSTATCSLFLHGKLWGFFALWNYSDPTFFNTKMKREMRAFSRAFMERYQECRQAENARTISTVQDRKREVLSSFSAQTTVASSISTLPALEEVISANSAAFVIDDKVFSSGDAPPNEFILEIKRWLTEHHAEERIYSNRNLGAVFPEAKKYSSLASGILASRIGIGNPGYVLWFRPEILHERKWAGKPEKIAAEDDLGKRLQPRTSFERWSAEVQGQSEEWRWYELEVADQFRDECSQIFNELFLRELRDTLEQLQDLKTSGASSSSCTDQTIHSASAIHKNAIELLEGSLSSSQRRLAEEIRDSSMSILCASKDS